MTRNDRHYDVMQAPNGGLVKAWTRGVSVEPGVYFLGLPWQSRRGSSFIWGVWHDAKHVADHILTRLKYLEYSAYADGKAKSA